MESRAEPMLLQKFNELFSEIFPHTEPLSPSPLLLAYHIIHHHHHQPRCTPSFCSRCFFTQQLHGYHSLMETANPAGDQTFSDGLLEIFGVAADPVN